MKKFLRASFRSSISSTTSTCSDECSSLSLSSTASSTFFKKSKKSKSKQAKQEQKKVSFAGFRKIRTVHKVPSTCIDDEHARELWYSNTDKQSFHDDCVDTYETMMQTGKSYEEAEAMGYCTRGLEAFVPEYFERVQNCRKEAMLAVFMEQRAQYLTRTHNASAIAEAYAAQCKWNMKLAFVNAKYDAQDAQNIYASDDETLSIQRELRIQRRLKKRRQRLADMKKQRRSGSNETGDEDATATTSRSSFSSISTLGLPDDLPELLE